MARYNLVTRSCWAGTECYHEIDGDFESPEDALEAFGGEDAAYDQAIEDHCPEYSIELIEDE